METHELEQLAIEIEGDTVEFALARDRAQRAAAEKIDAPMLIAWFDGKKGEEHPQVPECQHKPGWLAYAEGHGGSLRVDVNGDEYSFIFTSSGIPADD